MDIASNLQAIYTISQDQRSITFTVTLQAEAWLSFGVSTDGSMIAGTEGSDVVICYEGMARRFHLTTMETPNIKQGKPISGSTTCVVKDGTTTLAYTRKLEAQSGNELPVSLAKGGLTTFIYAWQLLDEVAEGGLMPYHYQNRGNINYNIKEGIPGNSSTITVPVLLWVHMVLMSLAWSAFFPFAVAIVKFKKSAIPHWVTIHKMLVACGYMSQAAGIIVAVSYVEGHGALHFTGITAFHKIIGVVVFALATIQPAIALFRPKVTTPKTPARAKWESVHKYTGYVTVGLGVINVALGVVAALLKQFSYTYIVASLAVSVILFVVVKANFCEKETTRIEPDLVIKFENGKPVISQEINGQTIASLDMTSDSRVR
jgi:hypothetical protein